jgi:hypothetical protein
MGTIIRTYWRYTWMGLRVLHGLHTQHQDHSFPYSQNNPQTVVYVLRKQIFVVAWLVALCRLFLFWTFMVAGGKESYQIPHSCNYCRPYLKLSTDWHLALSALYSDIQKSGKQLNYA